MKPEETRPIRVLPPASASRPRRHTRATRARLAACSGVALLVVACAPAAKTGAPSATPTSTDVAKLTTLEDVMELQEAIAEPQFHKSKQSSYDQAEWAALADASTRIQATSLKIKDFTRSPEFDALAMQLHGQAAELGRAASVKDAKATSEALNAVQATCNSCHKKFR